MRRNLYEPTEQSVIRPLGREFASEQRAADLEQSPIPFRDGLAPMRERALHARALANYGRRAREEYLAELNAENVRRGLVPPNRTGRRRQNEAEGGLDCCILMMLSLIVVTIIAGQVAKVLLGGGPLTDDLKVLLNSVNINYPTDKSNTDILNDLTFRIVNICNNPSTFTNSPELMKSINNILKTYKKIVIYPQLLTLSNKLNDMNKK